MARAKLTVEDGAEMDIDSDSLATGTAISKRKLKVSLSQICHSLEMNMKCTYSVLNLQQLVKEGLSPFPNNFFSCNILLDLEHREEIHLDGFHDIECRDIFGERIFDFRAAADHAHAASTDGY